MFTSDPIEADRRPAGDTAEMAEHAGGPVVIGRAWGGMRGKRLFINHLFSRICGETCAKAHPLHLILLVPSPEVSGRRGDVIGISPAQPAAARRPRRWR